jgi:hypothetical protein
MGGNGNRESPELTDQFNMTLSTANADHLNVVLEPISNMVTEEDNDTDNQ